VGCGRDAQRAARATEYDSAGVQIVESSAPEWADSTRWRLSDSPRVSIGVVEGDPLYQLASVTRAVRLSDGRIVIANAGSGELRFYSASGTYLSASGRTGDGPGEFRSLYWMTRIAGDSLVAFDEAGGVRISVFDSSGRFVRATRLTEKSRRLGPQRVMGRLADGSLAMLWVDLFGSRPTTGVFRTSAVILRYGGDGALVDTIGPLPGGDQFQTLVPGGGSITWYLPFGRTAAAVAHGNAIYYGSGERYQIDVYAPDGTMRRSIRRAYRNPEVTREAIEGYKQQELDDVTERGTAGDDRRHDIEHRFAEMPFPKTMRAYDGMMRVDADDDLWVLDYQWKEGDEPRWTVFDSTGRLLGQVAMPKRFTPYDIGTDYVVGKWQDELDVQYVRLYALEKGEPTARIATGPRG
jgi:hypothetical protein